MPERVSVEEVSGRREERRFAELPFALYRDEPRWVATARPARERAGDVRFLARVGGRLAGRLAVKRDGRFGAFDAVDSPEVVAGLVEAARSAVAVALHGPVGSIRVDGFDVPGATAHPWTPPYLAGHLVAAGLAMVDRREWFWIDLDPGRADPVSAPKRGRDPLADPRLRVPGATAVPDVDGAVAASRVTSAWGLARQARSGWTAAVVTVIEGDASDVVPALAARAAGLGYRRLLAPWAPSGTPAAFAEALFAGGE